MPLPMSKKGATPRHAARSDRSADVQFCAAGTCIDQIARVRVTFRYSGTGIEGLLKGKKAYVAIATGGVPLGAAVDFVSPYVRHILGFVGINDVTLIDASRLNFEGETKVTRAKAEVINLLTPALAA
jgi:FMN-dependent NADH-azoreductase